MNTGSSSKEIMSKNVITVKTSDTMITAWKIMSHNEIRHLPVRDAANKVIGILSDRDVQRAMRVFKKNSYQQEIHLDPELIVEDFMSWPVYVIHESTSVKRVAEEMLAQKVSAFIVEDNLGQMKGIITTDDLLKLLLEEPVKFSDRAIKGITQYFSSPEIA